MKHITLDKLKLPADQHRLIRRISRQIFYSTGAQESLEDALAAVFLSGMSLMQLATKHATPEGKEE